MNVKAVMTKEPACCTVDTPLATVASEMLENDCGAIPVVDDLEHRKPVGIVTDRDIAVRAVAKGMDPETTKAGDVMSRPLVTVSEKASVEACAQAMEANQVRRVLVLDGDGCCHGIVAQADVALHAPDRKAGEVVRRISQPSHVTADVG